MIEADVRNAETAQLLKALRSAYKKTFETTSHGKAVLDDLRKCLPEVSIKAGTADPYKMYYDMGRRSVMLMIEEKLKERK